MANEKNFGKSALVVRVEMPPVDSCEARLRMAHEAIDKLLMDKLRFMSRLYEGDRETFVVGHEVTCDWKVVAAEGKQHVMELLHTAAVCLMEAQRETGNTELLSMAMQIQTIKRGM